MSREADEQDGICILLDLVHFHLVGAVEKNDHFAKAFTHHFQQIALVLVQGQRTDGFSGAALVVLVLHDQVCTLSAFTGENHNRGIAVLSIAVRKLLIESAVLFTARCRAGHSHGHAAPALLHHAARGGACQKAVPECLVDLEPAVFQRGLQINGIDRSGLCLGAGRSSLIGRIHCAVAEHGNFGHTLQRQNAVLVHQERSAFPHLIDVLLKRCRNGLRLGIGAVECTELTLVIGGIRRRRAFFHHTCRIDAELTVDVARVCRGKRVADHCDHHQDRKDGCQTGPQFFMFQTSRLLQVAGEPFPTLRWIDYRRSTSGKEEELRIWSFSWRNWSKQVRSSQKRSAAIQAADRSFPG